jgi:AraC family transcriptional regulator
MDILEGLNAAVQYIEGHLRDQPDMARAARLASHSADGFMRMFSYLTGMSVSEYLRRRRLTQAARDLQRGRAVLETALRWGYGSPDAFRRAFVKQHGITPSEAKTPGAALKIYPALAFKINFQGGKEMDFRIVETPEIRLKGVSKAFEGQASGRFEQEHLMWADHHDNAPGLISKDYPGEWFGIWDAGAYRVARRPEDVDGTGPLEGVAIPGGTYAAFRTGYGGFAGDELPRLRGEIFGAWLGGSGYRQARDYEVEVYHLAPKEEKEKRYYEILVPVEAN